MRATIFTGALCALVGAAGIALATTVPPDPGGRHLATRGLPPPDGEVGTVAYKCPGDPGGYRDANFSVTWQNQTLVVTPSPVGPLNLRARVDASGPTGAKSYSLFANTLSVTCDVKVSF